MKELVDREKLLEQLCTYKGKRKKPAICLAYHKLVEHCSLSPAELAEENLKALAVLEKVKEYLKGKMDGHLVGMRNLIQNLESDASREERSK